MLLLVEPVQSFGSPTGEDKDRAGPEKALAPIPLAPARLQHDTVTTGYSGTLLIGENLLLLCNVFDSDTVIASRDRAMALYRKLLHGIDLRWDAAKAELLHAMIKFLE